MSLKSLRGVHVPHRKNTAAMSPLVIPTPKTVVIPMSMHIGAPAVPVVKPGDTVRVGQMIGEATGFVSASVFASVSGTVKKLDFLNDVMGRRITTVVIESDGAMTPAEGLAPRTVNTSSELADAARDCGLVGLGGAGFPTAVKLAADPAKVEQILINCAECEPYITADTRTMLDETDALVRGAHLLAALYSADVIFGVESNKREAIAKLKEAFSGEAHISVATLPAIYPQGGEKVLIYQCTGKIVGEGKLPLDVGTIVLNCSTLAKLVDFLDTGMPLVSRSLTVDGSAVSEPKNVTAPIGTPMQEIFDFCGGFRREVKKVLYGGPMMGIAVPDTSYPIMKNTNAILAMGEDTAVIPEPTACIRCGKCASACPIKLTPYAIAGAVASKNVEALAELSVGLCMECGCCSYICPARRPLVTQNKLGKSILKNAQGKAGK